VVAWLAVRSLALLTALLAVAVAAPAPAAPSAAPCRTAQLRVTLHSAGITSGNVLANAVLTNTSGAACTLRGYPVVQLQGEDRRARPTRVSHAGLWGSERVSAVRLAPAGIASFTVQYGIVSHGGGACAVAELRVTPPGGTGYRLVRPGVVDCARGRIWVSAIHAGNRGVLG
jgi:hypothetical protein